MEITRRSMLAKIRRLSIEEQRELVRKAAQGPLEPEELECFLDNARHALASDEIHENRLGFLSSYASYLEETLLQGSLSRHELAFILTSIAYSVLFGENDEETAGKIA